MQENELIKIYHIWFGHHLSSFYFTLTLKKQKNYNLIKLF